MIQNILSLIGSLAIITFLVSSCSVTNSNLSTADQTLSSTHLIATALPTHQATPRSKPSVEPTIAPTPTTEPPDALFPYTRAVQLLRAAQYEDVIPQFAMVIRILPDFAQAYHGRGLAYYHDEQLELAIEDFNKAIELKPDFADAYRNRGVTYLNSGNIIRGTLDLQKALSIYEESGDSFAVKDLNRLLGNP